MITNRILNEELMLRSRMVIKFGHILDSYVGKTDNKTLLQELDEEIDQAMSGLFMASRFRPSEKPRFFVRYDTESPGYILIEPTNDAAVWLCLERNRGTGRTFVIPTVAVT